MKGPFARSADVLLAVFADAAARAGDTLPELCLDDACNDASTAQWRAFAEREDSVACVSWCADKLRFWGTPAFKRRRHEPPVLVADMPVTPFAIMSPDGRTDWTIAAWHIHVRTRSPAPFDEHVLARTESPPALASTRDIAALTSAS